MFELVLSIMYLRRTVTAIPIRLAGGVETFSAALAGALPRASLRHLRYNAIMRPGFCVASETLCYFRDAVFLINQPFFSCGSRHASETVAS